MNRSEPVRQVALQTGLRPAADAAVKAAPGAVAGAPIAVPASRPVSFRAGKGPGAQDRVRRRRGADPGPGLRAVPRGRRDRGSSQLRAANAADGRANARLLERCGPAVPSVGAGTGGEDRAVVKAMVGLQAGKTPRQIAVDIYGADEVRANWYSHGGMRSQVRRWIDKALALADGGWRDLVPRATGPPSDGDSARYHPM